MSKRNFDFDEPLIPPPSGCLFATVINFVVLALVIRLIRAFFFV
jgi:hypothetical protein